MSQALEQKVDRLINTVASLRNELRSVKTKETWVGVGAVTELTGWEGEKLRWARNNNLIKFDKEKGYLLESIPELFIIKKQTA